MSDLARLERRLQILMDQQGVSSPAELVWPKRRPLTAEQRERLRDWIASDWLDRRRPSV
jgi:hypothetical protein